MISFGNNRFNTIPISLCNLNGLVKYVYPVSAEFAFCPMCGKELKEEYVYAIRISEDECIKVTGKACNHCSAFFSEFCYLLERLETKRYDKDAYVLKNDYCVNYDKAKYASLYKTRSAFRQYTLCRTNEIVTYTIVHNNDKMDLHKNVMHYSQDLAYSLMLAEQQNERFILINGKQYTIVKIRNKPIADPQVMDQINLSMLERNPFSKHEIREQDNQNCPSNVLSWLDSSGIASNRALNNGIPHISSDNTLYVYASKTACHRNHHIENYRAILEPLGDTAKRFYVEYCRECNKFYINIRNYEVYLKRLIFIPIRVKMVADAYTNLSDYNRAEKSPLYLHGYTVSSERGYSAAERQRILAGIMDFKILEKHQILDYLHLFIQTNGQASNMKYAVSKWEEDKEFVLNYKLAEHPLVVIGRIEQLGK